MNKVSLVVALELFSSIHKLNISEGGRRGINNRAHVLSLRKLGDFINLHVL